MSGHSKWHNIQAKKGKADAARGRIFTKIGREIAVAAKLGSDPALNSKLADAIAKAKAANMPNDNIIRSIKKASGELSSTNYEVLTYEGYGVGGSAVIVETLTDNKNRTVGEVRHLFDKGGGAMGATGCVSFMFDKKGVIVVERTATLTEDAMMEMAIECGADDVVTEDDVFVVYTTPADFSEVRKALEAQNLVFLEASVQMVPQNKVELSEEDTAKFLKMIDLLEDNDDVQEVWHNVILPEEEDED